MSDNYDRDTSREDTYDHSMIVTIEYQGEKFMYSQDMRSGFRRQGGFFMKKAVKNKEYFEWSMDILFDDLKEKYIKACMKKYL